jgi:hypothetical protein
MILEEILRVLRKWWLQAFWLSFWAGSTRKLYRYIELVARSLCRLARTLLLL